MVVYNGARPWTASRNFKETLDGHERYGSELLDFQYILLDVNRYDPEELFELRNLMASALLLDQRVDDSELLDRLPRLAGTISDWDEARFHMFKNWVKGIMSRGLREEKKEEIIRIIDQTNPQEVDQMIYNMEIALKEAYERAELKGKADLLRAMMQKGQTLIQISEMTGLTIKEIEHMDIQ